MAQAVAALAIALQSLAPRHAQLTAPYGLRIQPLGGHAVSGGTFSRAPTAGAHAPLQFIVTSSAAARLVARAPDGSVTTLTLPRGSLAVLSGGVGYTVSASNTPLLLGELAFVQHVPAR